MGLVTYVLAEPFSFGLHAYVSESDSPKLGHGLFAPSFGNVVFEGARDQFQFLVIDEI